MSDIRCPMCGKPNPADAKTCLHCGAQIQPKHLNSFEDEFSDSEDQISWLRDLQGSSDEPLESEGQDEQLFSSEDPDAEMPDWLTRIRERSRFEDQAAARAAVDHDDQPGDTDEDVPDWMQDLKQDEQSKPDMPSGDEDWLGSLRNAEMADEVQADQDADKYDSSQELPLEDQVIDRLSLLGAEPFGAAPEEPESEPAVEDADNEEPFKNEAPFSETTEDNLEDWLSKLDAEEPIQETRDREAAIPDWLGAAASEEETPDSREDLEGESIPDWLNLSQELPAEESTQVEEPVSQIFQPEQDESEPTESTPDWLHAFEAESSAESDLQTAGAQDVEKPDWLSEIADEVFEETSSEEPDEGETIDWISQMGMDQAPVVEAGEVPEWLSNIEKESTGQVLPESVAGRQEEKQGPSLLEEASFERKDSAPGIEGDLEEQMLAGVLSGMGSENEPSESFFSESGQEISQELFRDEIEESDVPVPAEEIPFETGEKSAELSEVSPFLKDDLPDWLSEAHEESMKSSGSGTASAFTLEEEREMEIAPSSAYPFSGKDAPEWLSEEAGLQDMEGAIEEAKEDVEIAPAQMPSWLQAMRPVEAVAPGKARSRKPSAIEKAGPLAGLQGVLPAEDLATQYRKPPVYSAKLHVSENQRTHAELFENILEQESQSKPARNERIQAPQWIIRLVIAALLISVLVLPMLVNPFSNPPALSFPAESVTNFYQQVETLPEGAPVLVAFDYDPGFSGEMRFAAVGVLERLIIKHARIAAISTVAQGPILGEALLQTAFQRASTVQSGLAAKYSLNEQTINLGYLAGGLASLQEFSVRPKQAVQYGFDSGFDGESVWNKSVLRGVNQPGDFAMVVIITDNVDTGRSWIEQVQPVLGSKPMLFVTSAQASPMLLPYVHSGQVKGLLSGMSGGMAYEKLVGSPEASISYFNAYQYAMILGVAFVLLGLFFKILMSLFARRKAKSEA